MALILNLEENKALVLQISKNEILDKLIKNEKVGKYESNEGTFEFITMETLYEILEDLECSILPRPNYETGGTKVTLGIPKEIIATQRRNKNLPYLNSSSGL